ncbi:MAG: cbb3-type cytochrome c oxidase subunit I [Burkholderiales bacterium]|nr:cbb3-type cytochrome c oxidase subunit I [Burkholderiales bacterium]
MAEVTARPAARRDARAAGGAGARGLGRLGEWLARPRGAYLLVVPDDARARLARGWLALALAAIIGAGLYSILLVVSRTPGLAGLFPVENFFRVALVVHVDLSVLVWFVAIAGIFWSLNSTRRWTAFGWAALASTVAGTALMTAAPFAQRAEPVMANYIPVLDGAVFLGGLAAMGAGVAMLCVRGMVAVPRVGTRLDGAAALRFGLNSSVVATAVALAAFAWSWIEVPRGLEGQAYYELLFWGGGHVLQFAWTLLMMVSWLWLASAIGAPVPLTPRVAALLFAVALVSVFATPLIYLAYAVPSVEHYRLLTWLMRFGGGLAMLPMMLAVTVALVSARGLDVQQRPLRAALASSLVLFAVGGLIGFTIEGSNVRIPAHYHGSIVGVTLAFMGVVYHLLPRLGYRAPAGRLATWQPYVYGAGQLMHVAGLLWSGGYGVQRKVAGSEQVLRTTSEVVGMGFMGLGGLVAIAGGVLFLVVVLRCMTGGRARAAGTPA